MPNMAAAAVGRSTGHRAKHVGSAFQPQQSEEGKDKRFLVVNGLVVRDNNKVLRVMLYALDEEGVVGSSACDKHLAWL